MYYKQTSVLADLGRSGCKGTWAQHREPWVWARRHDDHTHSLPHLAESKVMHHQESGTPETAAPPALGSKDAGRRLEQHHQSKKCSLMS